MDSISTSCENSQHRESFQGLEHESQGHNLFVLRHTRSTAVLARRQALHLREERLVCFDKQPAPAPHLARPEGCAALRIVLVTVPRVSRSCEHFPDGFNLDFLREPPTP